MFFIYFVACKDTIPSSCRTNKTCQDYAPDSNNLSSYDYSCVKDWNEFSYCDDSTLGRVSDTCQASCNDLRCKGNALKYAILNI